MRDSQTESSKKITGKLGHVPDNILKILDRGHFVLGVVFGVLASLITGIYLELFNPTLISESLFAALLGAVVGGGIAYWGQVLVLRSAAAERLDAQNLARAATVRSIYLKYMDLLNQVQKLHNYYRTYENRHLFIISVKGKPDVYFWKPLQGDFSHHSLSLEEKSSLIGAGEVDFFNLNADMEGISKNISMLTKLHQDLISEFEGAQIKSGKAKIEGGIIRASGPPDPIGLARIQDVEKHLRESLRIGLPMSYEAINHCVRLLAATGVKISHEFRDDISGQATYDQT